MQVDSADSGRAVEAAGENVEEGAVGAGTGMICFGWKGGIGTSSRRVGDAHVGVLVLANFGRASELRIDGVPVGRLLDPPPTGREAEAASSCIGVVVTDAPLRTHQLRRLARRVGLGLARTGSFASHGSGEIFIALSTGDGEEIGGYAINAFFTAVVDATEEAVVNCLWAAIDTDGRHGRLITALPHDPVLALLREHGRL